MQGQRATAGVCALFLLAGCGNSNRLTDREWDAVFSEGVKASHKNCQKVSTVGSPGYYRCEGDQPAEPYIDHLFR